MTELVVLDSRSTQFPDPNFALEEPNGLLAVGGDLSPARLLAAYRSGIFPWYDEDQPILWWSPEPRAVLKRDAIRVSTSLKKRLRRGGFEIRTDTEFSDVIYRCSISHGLDTWISNEMIEAYEELHTQGHAHSVEVWVDNELVGGLYGIAVGELFCGESMFHDQTDASKIAFVALHDTLYGSGFKLIDCQLPNPHLESLGVTTISRDSFLTDYNRNGSGVEWPKQWHIDASKYISAPSSGAHSDV